MALKIHTLLTGEEHSKLNEEAIAKGYWRDDPRMIKPGTMWYTPWIHDPNDPSDQERREKILKHIQDGTFDSKNYMLSKYYWLEHSDKRPPICVMCPNGSMWIIDQAANNGPGWQITGEGMNLTAMPSIVVPGYHGWLKNGEFTDDVEGRGPFGIMRVIEERKVEKRDE